MSRRHFSATLLACYCSHTHASSPLLEDLLVSATPAPRPLMETPVAVTVFDEARVSAFGIQSFEDLSLRTPAMNLIPLQGGLAIRGIGGSGAAYPPAVAVHMDGVYVGDWRFLDAANFFDSERVEVLRGPMGVSHGRNALGGSINLVSTPPPMTWQSKVVATAGNFDYWGLQGLIRGPITDQFSMSVAGSIVQQSAWEEETESVNDRVERNDDYLRAAFTYHWNNLWYSKLQAFSTETDTGSLDNAYLVNEVAVGDYRLKYVAAWTDREGIYDNKIVAHELQFYSALDGPLNLEAGIEYIDEDMTLAEQKSQSTFSSVWSELQWQLSERLRTGLGLRYSEDELQSTEERSDDTWDWQVGLDYHISASHMLYAKAATGHGSLAKRGAGNHSSGAESLRSIELGYKGSLLQGLQATAAIFHYRPDDIAGFTDDSSGMELEVTWEPGEGLGMGGSWAWTDSDRPATAAAHQVSAFAIAEWLWGWAGMQARVEYHYRSEFCVVAQACNATGRTETHSQWDLGLSANYQQWTLRGYIDNLADERSGYPLPANSTGQQNQQLLSAPREYGIELVYQLR